MQIPNGADTVEPVLERSKSRRLRKKHQQAIQAFVEMRILVRLEQLESEVLTSQSDVIHIHRNEDVQVNTGDSKS